MARPRAGRLRWEHMCRRVAYGGDVGLEPSLREKSGGLPLGFGAYFGLDG